MRISSEKRKKNRYRKKFFLKSAEILNISKPWKSLLP